MGLDIGSSSIKCVEVSPSADKFKLHRARVVPLADATPETAAKALRQLLDGQRPAQKHVRISVSGPSVLIRRVQLPTMTGEELKGAIRFEAERYIPFPIDDCVLDFQILGAADAGNMNVMLVAAKSDFVQERVKLLMDLGATPELIDVDVFSAINAFETLGDPSRPKAYALAYIGHATTLFMIVNGGIPYFVREIPQGARNVTRALVDATGSDEAKCDEAKKKKEPAQAEVLKAATRKGLEPIAAELKNSIAYFENDAGEELKQVWVAGGGALSLDAGPYLTEELGRPVAVWDELSKLELGGDVEPAYLSQHAAELEIAVGLALRNVRK